MTYPKGSLVELNWRYINTRAGNALYDPDVPKLTVSTPGGNTTTYTYPTDIQIVKDGVGVYHFDLDVSSAGTYTCRAWATGTGQASSDNFTVEVMETI